MTIKVSKDSIEYTERTILSIAHYNLLNSPKGEQIVKLIDICNQLSKTYPVGSITQLTVPSPAFYKMYDQETVKIESDFIPIFSNKTINVKIRDTWTCVTKTSIYKTAIIETLKNEPTCNFITVRT